MRPVDISIGVVLRTVLVILALWFLYLIRDVLALLFLSVVLVSAIEPMVDWLQKKRIPRSLGVLFIYIALFFLIGLSIYFLIPPIQDQFHQFSNNFSQYSQMTSDSFRGFQDFLGRSHIAFNTEKFFQNLSDTLSANSGGIFATTVGFFSGLISTIVVLSLTFYMAAKEDGFKRFITLVVPDDHKEYAISLTERIKDKIGRWMQGQLVLMFVVFVLDYIGLLIVGVPYALVLAIFAGIMEIIPYVGPIISAIPGIILGFLISPLTGVLVFLVYVVVQQLENHVITPQIMKKAVGLNPIVVILALLVGAKLGGAFGAILAIPVATAGSIFIGDIMNKKKM